MMPSKTRTAELAELFTLLQEILPHSGKYVSLGCGLIPELPFVENFDNVFVDMRQIVHDTETIVKMSDIEYLDSCADCKVDFLAVFDIDSSIQLDDIISLAEKKLTPQGVLLITERKDNVRLYGRCRLPEISDGARGTKELAVVTRPTNFGHYVLLLANSSKVKKFKKLVH
jgi:hypothetical protein